MFIVTKHKYASLFTCNEKVSEYIQKGLHCFVIVHGNDYSCCFGKYPDKMQAKTRKDELKSNHGLTCKISEVK